MLLKMTVNKEPVEVEVAAGDMLADVLRDKLGLIGTKIACGEAECGACTILLDGEAILSCICPAMKAQGREVITIEGLAPKGQLHPVQEAFIEHFASQCGFCTPGFIMSSVALLQENPIPTREEILEYLSGNLCRCTGYYQIVEAVQSAAAKMAAKE
jgi:carbon-monoxide dehydrogenase small subunit